jgi:hypothetical protein
VIWWTLLIWIVEKLIDWLISKDLRRERLTEAEISRVNHFLYLAHRADERAARMGCVRGGRLP